jgi:sulfur-carrier protein
MPVVRIPSVLRKHTDGAAKVDVDGASVRDVFNNLIAKHPELGDSLLDGDTVRGFINVYIDDEDIRYIGGLDAPCEAHDEIAIMPAVAGGSTSLAPR